MENLKSFLCENLNLAISAHNSQPFKIKSISETDWAIVDIPTRALPVADPHGKDHDMTAGAYLELISLLLNTKGYELTNWDKVNKNFHFRISNTCAPEKVALSLKNFELAKKRFSFRGMPEKINTTQKWNASSFYFFLKEPKEIATVAEIYDRVNLRYLVSEGYIEELYQWLRFKKSDQNYLKDGLNIEAMGLSTVEALGAAQVMKPKVFRSLANLGFAKGLVAESGKIKKASALMVIHCPAGTNYVDQGRYFYRAWLAMTEMGYFGCPMSLLSDADKEKTEIYSSLGLDPKNKQLVNVLRACVLPSGYVRYQPARLIASEVSE